MMSLYKQAGAKRTITNTISLILQIKLFSGANIELKDLDYLTPLMMACRYGYIETISCLLKHGANVTETDKDDKTCLMWAAEENRVEAIMV